MKIIHCNLWGDIELSDLAISIIDTPHFQRLHYIRQTGLSYKVFPNTHTTRFEHSIGVYGITKIFLNHLISKQFDLKLNCDERKLELISIAGLIHDLGHGPFSHFFDAFLEYSNINNLWNHHEQRSIDIFKEIITKYRILIEKEEIEFIEKLIKGEEGNKIWYNPLINNQIYGLDMDKIDYILRDAMSFGIKIQFDIQRIINNSRVIENKLSFSQKIKDDIMNVFLIRNRLHSNIYRHKKIIEFENILMYFLNERGFGNEILSIIKYKNIEKFIQWNDQKIINSLPFEEYSLYECRKLKMAKHFNKKYIDKEFEKIKNVMFYDNKNLYKNFKLNDWDICRCF